MSLKNQTKLVISLYRAVNMLLSLLICIKEKMRKRRPFQCTFVCIFSSFYRSWTNKFSAIAKMQALTAPISDRIQPDSPGCSQHSLWTGSKLNHQPTPSSGEIGF